MRIEELTKNKKRVLILGAGPAGLGAAYCLSEHGYNVTVLDRAHYLGGASASFKIKDYIVDYGPHAFHIKKKEIVDMVKRLVGEDFIQVRRKSRLILDGKNLSYPLNIKEALFKINPLLSFRIVFDYVLARLKYLGGAKSRVKTFEDWGMRAFGYKLYRLAFGDYSEKMWGISGSKLSEKLAQQKLQRLNLTKLLFNLLGLGGRALEGGVTEYFDMYPRYGIGTLFDRMSEVILKSEGNQIHLEAKVLGLDIENNKTKKIRFQDQLGIKEVSFDYLVSSIPLKYLAGYLDQSPKKEMLAASQELKYKDIRVIYVILNKDYYSDVHWFYLLDPHFRFNRLSEQKNLNKESSPAGKTVISMDISCSYGDQLWNMSEEEFFNLALKDLSHLGVERSHILEYFSLRLQDVYPIYSLGFDQDLTKLISHLSRYTNVYSTGRQGLFLNNDIHDSLEMGMSAGRFIIEEQESAKWYDYVKEYISQRLEGNVK